MVAWGAGARERLDGSLPSQADLAMERYADGDEASFSALYDELEPRLRRYALGQTRSSSAADDTVQQTLLQLHLARDRFVRGAAVVPWAYAIARNLLRDARRHEGQTGRLAREGRGGELGPTGAVPPDEALELKQREAGLRGELERLPVLHREAFQLVKLEGLTVAEAAQVLGITPGNVKVRVHRAAAALRASDELRDVGGERAAAPATPGPGAAPLRSEKGRADR